MTSPCPVVHFEMPYRDAARAARFYAEAFGWQMQQFGPEMGDYLLATTATTDSNAPGAVRGAINGGLFPFKPDWPMQHPSVVIGVDDVRAAMARVTAAGGEVLGEPMAIPGVGDYVSFVDTEGNRHSLLQPAMGEGAGAA
ncbi:MAG TPA: VOC family protein [Burkholderiaceae bacterium]|nr:VOC family protein [Burkholderiaceae bacterium]HMX11624.1 VOC family protein [Burkholderiaceae bacterium]HMY99199.1 VOC family protein [Burkholderiaceae bacterium]HNB43932.1 VOC family protein [Burkholderiaceae bacterium]HNG78797.1 VOC family protein [Burkholderiaceae bacterium]